MASKDSKLKNIVVVVSDHHDDEKDEKKETKMDIGVSLNKLNLGLKKKLLVIPLGGIIVHRANRLRPTTIPRNRSPDFSYGNFLVLSNIMGEQKSKLLFIWDQKESTNTGFKCLDNKDKPLFLKELKHIWQKKYSNLPWRDGEYSSSNTLLITTPVKALLNPPNTSINIDEYDPNNTVDDFLGPKGSLRAFLDGLVEAEDVPTYVQSHPFGEPAITPSHSDWEYYSNVIRTMDKKETNDGKN